MLSGMAADSICLIGSWLRRGGERLGKSSPSPSNIVLMTDEGSAFRWEGERMAGRVYVTSSGVRPPADPSARRQGATISEAVHKRRTVKRFFMCLMKIFQETL